MLLKYGYTLAVRFLSRDEKRVKQLKNSSLFSIFEGLGAQDQVAASPGVERTQEGETVPTLGFEGGGGGGREGDGGGAAARVYTATGDGRGRHGGETGGS